MRDQGVVEIIENQAFEFVAIMIGKIAEFEIDIAILRDDVELRAAMDHAAVEGRVIGHEFIIMRAFIAEFLAKAAQEHHEFGCEFNRIDTFARQRRMARPAGEMCAGGIFAFMLGDDLHVGGFAHDAHGRLMGQGIDCLDQAWHAKAADFLVIGEGKMDRHAQISIFEGFCLGQQTGQETLHIAGPAAIKFVAADIGGERVGCPVLAFDRDHVAVT